MRKTRFVSALLLGWLAACGSGSGGFGGPDGGGGSGGSSGSPSCTKMCSGKCSDPTSDHTNCGFCGNACGSYQTCTAGVCSTSKTCPPAFSGAPSEAAAALETENKARLGMGIPCATLVPAADKSALLHCEYFAANRMNMMCIADPHVEVTPGCADYVAAQFYDRMTAAGYTGQAAFEDMAFVDNGAAATQTWIDSIWHRIPILSPWIEDIGYGGAPGSSAYGQGCDTMDFGIGGGAMTPYSVTAVYPYPGQTDVPTAFCGALEGPPPNPPPAGWPSGYPITVYLKNAQTASVHTITKLGSTANLDHQMITPSMLDPYMLVTDEIFLYTNAPLEPKTHYHVHVEATGGAGNVTFDWVFTTGMPPMLFCP